jgi:aspartate carbamoyltransferase catalytic subunit
VLNFDASTSSTRKGETACDTLRNLEAMGVRGFVVRHPEDGAVAALAEAAGEGTALINAGDGRSAHPTQGLLDMLTLRQAKGPDFSNESGDRRRREALARGPHRPACAAHAGRG